MAIEGGLGFEITELRLGLPGASAKNDKKRAYSEITNDENSASSGVSGSGDHGHGVEGKIQNKNQIVGWPPVCSYRRMNSINDNNKGSIVHDQEVKNICGSAADNSKDQKAAANNQLYVKIGMDGAPYLRKIDLHVHESYADLAVAFEKLFGCFGIGGMWEDCDSSEYIPIYEDKDGDWMLVGDVPWEMFIDSCIRLRIMKRLDAKQFALPSKKAAQ